MVWELAAAMAATTLLQMYSKNKENDSEQSMLHAQEELKLAEIAEIMARKKANIQQLNEEAKDFLGKQRTTAASSGTDVGSGSNLLLYEDTAYRLASQISRQREEASYLKGVLMKEITGSQGAAYRKKKSTQLSQAGTLFKGGISTVQAYNA